jgi:hypothetical protein
MSIATSKATKADTLARVQALIAGLQKRFPNGSFTLGNVAFTTAALVQLFQGLADAIVKANAATASARDAVAAERAERAKVSPTLVTLKRVLVATFGDSAQTLADFGLVPAKARAPRTSLANAAAAAKATATRKARGTASPKKKAAVHGNVTGITVIPTTVPADAPPSPQPVPTASSVTPTGPATK